MGSGQQPGVVEARGSAREQNAEGAGPRALLPDGLSTTPENAPGPDSHGLLSSEPRFKQIVEATQQGVWTLDLEGFTTFANPALEAMLGSAPGTLLGRHVLDVIARDARQTAAHHLTRSRQGHRGSFELPLVRTDGHTLWARMVTGPLRDERGTLIGSAIAVFDVGAPMRSEQEFVHRRAAEAQRHDSLGILAGGIAHDFNNLLAVIIGQIELVTADTQIHTATASALSSAISAAQRAAGLTRQLLDYAGRSQLQERSIQLGQQTAELVRDARASLPPHIALELEVEDTDLTVLGDPDRLQQSAMHLLNNAVEAYAGSPGRVFLCVGRVTLPAGVPPDAYPPEPVEGGEYVYVEVRDEGHGMSPSTLARAFEPFFTTKTSARGLGLAACMGVIRAHGGVLTARSQVDRGSTFRVHLPLAQATQGGLTAESTAAVRASKRPLTVLVVDDEPMIRMFARSMLELEGYLVEDAASGAEALEILRSRLSEIGGVLLDLSMPGMDGSVVLSSLRTFAPDLPVVVQTGYSAEATAQRLAQWRVRGVLQKPYRATQLLESINSMFL